jgi:hypothetical protein
LHHDADQRSDQNLHGEENIKKVKTVGRGKTRNTQSGERKGGWESDKGERERTRKRCKGEGEKRRGREGENGGKGVRGRGREGEGGRETGKSLTLSDQHLAVGW